MTTIDLPREGLDGEQETLLAWVRSQLSSGFLVSCPIPPNTSEV